MTYTDLSEQILRKQSYLCVGLDTDLRKLPHHLLTEPDPVFAFNKAIIDATADFAVSYKPNIAFYEAQGPRGWESLQRTLEYIPADCFTIADAKRGDIGNTSGLYARTFFEPQAAGLNFDSITVAPYMGRDSVMPFLDYEGKWVILLALTSNPGSADFQRLVTTSQLDGGMAGGGGDYMSENVAMDQLYQTVIKTAQTWAGPDRMMFVVGATQTSELSRIRELAPDHFLLVPGVGAQGGSLAEVSRRGLTKAGGLLVNASRSILYASDGLDFAAQARTEAQTLQKEMALYLAERV
ncbi:orotidine-5'-phosphate decarboxylase [Spirosoma utsteinense]|uniref:Orotidine-5'-phosphate decarboxylase n=1 Tax=Spirosoma utsteinense TaxID=2585773 RepID=A0ABR6W7I3_9BACT|nr:orotidine-5'-phosphate decarboxylase [Spirosoma utsteinense]MBC3792525.1 orotidine-5'-phosphate decarboxylase [Spirosoma utsteinense]